MKEKQKKPSRSKEEIAFEMKQKQEVDKQKNIAKNVLYPILHEHAESVQHAQRACEIFKAVITQSMQMPFKEKTIEFLKLGEELTKEKDVKDRAMFEALINGFKDISITDSIKLLEGMAGSIDGYVRGESAKQDFKTVKVESLVN